MSHRLVLLAATALASMGAIGLARAETQLTEVDAVAVLARDRNAGLLEKRPNDTVFGLEKPLIETPRSASFVSDLTLQRYGIQTIDGLTAVSPGAYTASFYGVPGALNIRGTLAENYFRGFKRVENRGTYSTPIGAADQIQIVRGPPTPIYGSGKVGGMLNFIPKSGKGEGGYLTAPVGELAATFGSYNRKNASAQLGLPANFGEVIGGVRLYGEVEDSHSFYRGVYPRRQTGQVSADFDLGGGWSTAMGGMVHRSRGDVQTAGWNRLTQDLIDHGTYVTGRDASLVDANGDGRLNPGEIGGPLYLPWYGFPTSDAAHSLDVGLGTTKLSPRTVYVSAQDFSRTRTDTLYFDLARALSPESSLKLQLFYDALRNERFVSYGYPARFDSHVWEARATYDFVHRLFDDTVTARSFVGASYRALDGRRRESYNSGLIALDRRDLSHGPTPTDSIASVFTDPTMGWENDNRTDWSQAGVFFTTDIMVGPALNLILGGRYDTFDVTSHDVGVLSFTTPGEQSDSKGKATYSASASYRAPLGLMPYISYAKASAIEMGQAGDVTPALVADPSNGWLSDSDLAEAGVKFQWLKGALIGSLAGYRQNRTQLTGINAVPVGTRAKGVELELRWLASERLSFTFAGNAQRTTVKGPDASFQYIPAYAAGVPGPQGWGGSYVVWSFADVRPGDYDYSLIPKSVVSLYGAYSSREHDWGKLFATLGVTHVTKTAGLVPQAVTYPAYAVANGSIAYARGPYTATLNVDNLFDKLYFTPVADTYANLAALPGRGREWRLTLARRF